MWINNFRYIMAKVVNAEEKEIHIIVNKVLLWMK